RLDDGRSRGELCVCFFFFQAEDGIRDWSVTGVQTCALPISGRRPGPAGGAHPLPRRGGGGGPAAAPQHRPDLRGGRGRGSGGGEIGRASCRGKGEISGVGGSLKKKKEREGREKRRTSESVLM